MESCKLSPDRLEALRREYQQRTPHKGKYPRQRMLPEYKKIYPWIIPDDADPYFAFCTVCECRLRAKRTDLGKHEGSFKHTENAARKKSPSEENNAVKKTEIMEDDQEYDNYGHYLKHEPLVVLDENSTGATDFVLNQIQAGEKDDSDSGGENENLANPTSPNRPASTSSGSASLSQHSIPIDCYTTNNDSNIQQQFSIREVTGVPNAINTICHYPQNIDSRMSLATTQMPCKITIKKISAPPPTPTQSSVTGVPVPASVTIAQQPTLPTPNAHSVTSRDNTRDPLDLFFDSICASVKSLPPKLATEGKIRVMQLIGELELRAIDEHDQIDTRNTFQQNFTVASTTK